MNTFEVLIRFKKQIEIHYKRLYKFYIPISVLFLIVFIPRIIDLGVAPISEDLRWMMRSYNFVDGIRSIELERTYQTHHPGVTVMILSGFSMGVQYLLTGTLDSTQNYLFSAYLPTAILTTILAVFVYISIRILLSKVALAAWIAGLASVLGALEPYYLSLSRSSGRDPLLAVFMTVSFLLFVLFLEKRGDNRLLIASGLFAGIAVLTKLPGVIIFPILGTTYLAYWSIHGEGNMREGFKYVVIIGITSMIAFIALWPAMWVAPFETISLLVEKAFIESSRRSVTGGLVPRLFGWMLRISPGNLLLCLINIPFLIRKIYHRNWYSLDIIDRTYIYCATYVAGNAAFWILITGGLSYDWFLIPSIPVISIMSALSLYRIITNIDSYNIRLINPDQLLSVISILLILILILTLIPLHPYPGTYTNTVSENILVSSGSFEEQSVYVPRQGVALAAKDMRNWENAEEMIVATGTPHDYDVFFQGEGRVALIDGTWNESKADGKFSPVDASRGEKSFVTQRLNDDRYEFSEVDYLVLTVAYLNRRMYPEYVMECHKSSDPVKIYSINNHEQVYVYDVENCLYSPVD